MCVKKTSPTFSIATWRKIIRFYLFLVWIFLTQLAIKRTIQFPTSPSVCFIASALPRESRPSEICIKIYKNVKKTSPILSIIAWKKMNRFSQFLTQVFMTQRGIKLLFKFPHHLMSVSALPGEIWPSKIRVEMNEKTLINFIYPHLWLPTTNWLQGLTVVQQCVYQMAFRNVYEFKKSGLVWSRTSSTMLSIHEEIISVPVVAQCADISSSFNAGSWKRKQLYEISANMSKMWMKCVFCVLFRLCNDATLGKNVIFRLLCISQVVQEQTLGEVGNWIVVWWPVVSEIFVPKIIKIC